MCFYGSNCRRFRGQTIDHTWILHREQGKEDLLDLPFFLPYFESQLLRVFSGTIDEMSKHFIQFHCKIRYSFMNSNQWSFISLSNSFSPMSIENIKENFNPHSNYRGLIFNILNIKSHEFLRRLCELGRYGHHLHVATFNKKRLQCHHITKSIEKSIDNFVGVINEWSSIKECDCHKYKSEHYLSQPFTLLKNFIELILEPDYLSRDISFSKIIDILIIERVQPAEIIGILTIISALLNRSK